MPRGQRPSLSALGCRVLMGATIVVATTLALAVAIVAGHNHASKSSVHFDAPSVLEERAWIERVLKHLDDDHDGKITLRETQDAISNKLKSKSHSVDQFHKGDTELVADELFANWVVNPVREWDNAHVVAWAKEMHLTSCLDELTSLHIVGKDLVHLATSEHAIMKLCNSAVDRQRLKLRALDLVMFGPSPTDPWMMVLPMITGVSLISAVTLLFYFRKQNLSQRGVLRQLNSATSAVTDLEKKLEDYETALTESTSKRQELETKTHFHAQRASETESLRAELRDLREQQALARARLKDLLQATYEQETELLKIAKTLTHERKLRAQKQVDKLDSQRKSLLGVVRLTNSSKPLECEAEMHSVLEMYRIIGNIAHARSTRWQQLQRIVRFKLALGASGKGSDSNNSSSSGSRRIESTPARLSQSAISSTSAPEQASPTSTTTSTPTPSRRIKSLSQSAPP